MDDCWNSVERPGGLAELRYLPEGLQARPIGLARAIQQTQEYYRTADPRTRCRLFRLAALPERRKEDDVLEPVGIGRTTHQKAQSIC